jgi:hypothetical protein
MRRFLAALALGSALLLASVPAAFAWPDAVTDGAPDLNHDSPTGYYIWHNDDGFQLRTHGPNARHDFDARLRTDGIFEDVDVLRLEHRDGVQVLDGGHELVIHFNTFDATDGVSFRIDGGERLRLALRLDGRLIGTEHIFLGRSGDHPERNPFVLRR